MNLLKGRAVLNEEENDQENDRSVGVLDNPRIVSIVYAEIACVLGKMGCHVQDATFGSHPSLLWRKSGNLFLLAWYYLTICKLLTVYCVVIFCRFLYSVAYSSDYHWPHCISHWTVKP